MLIDEKDLTLRGAGVQPRPAGPAFVWICVFHFSFFPARLDAGDGREGGRGLFTN